MFVSGIGGTAKSFLIEAIKALIADIWPTDDLMLAVAAPTGLAAFNVGGGITTHRLFQLPVEHESKTAGYWSLPKPSQKLMKASLSKVKMFIIDEVSMVSSLNLAYMHVRLEELFGGNECSGVLRTGTSKNQANIIRFTTKRGQTVQYQCTLNLAYMKVQLFCYVVI